MSFPLFFLKVSQTEWCYLSVWFYSGPPFSSRKVPQLLQVLFIFYLTQKDIVVSLLIYVYSFIYGSSLAEGLSATLWEFKSNRLQHVILNLLLNNPFVSICCYYSTVEYHCMSHYRGLDVRWLLAGTYCQHTGPVTLQSHQTLIFF